jgi:hypothetical protein
MGARLVLALGIALAAQPGSAQLSAQPVKAQKPPPRLFASDQPIRFTLRGPIQAIASAGPDSTAVRPGRLILTAPAAEEHPVNLSARGIARRQRENCEFPPLKVEFTAKPPATSLFERQKKLKLVAHCRASPGFQQHVLLEYAAYKMLNVLTPTGFRVRLASVDYQNEAGKPIISRLGFFIEDPDDAGKRVGLKQVELMGRISSAQLEPTAAARTALFQYMVGNLDWSMRAGAAGQSCCHNAKLFAPNANARQGLIPVAYDFDFTGFVDAPYATPPEELGVSSVRERKYRGYCIHNPQALAVAADFRAKRGEMIAALNAVPQLEERTKRKAMAFLDGFYRDIATDADVQKRVLKGCIG